MKKNRGFRCETYKALFQKHILYIWNGCVCVRCYESLFECAKVEVPEVR